MAEVKVALLGRSGKMGQTLEKILSSSPTFSLSEDFHESDLIIDFSHPLATEKYLSHPLPKPLLIGTTGHTEEQREKIRIASREIPLLLSPNFSTYMNLCLQAIELVGKSLLTRAFIDILETHHIHKKDAPSGTALALAHAIDPHYSFSLEKGERKKEEICIHSIRSADVIGEHTVIFEGQGEKITLTHTVYSRDAFAYGALYAGERLIKKPPGLYCLKDLF